jgi:hypothetical protein
MSLRKEINMDKFDYKSLADLLLDFTIDMYGIREVIQMLKSAGYTRADLLYLQFDDIDISAVYDKD